MDDKFSVAFEIFINAGHALVERAGVSQNFADLAWQQVESGVRGETALDAWEARQFATARGSWSVDVASIAKATACRDLPK